MKKEPLTKDKGIKEMKKEWAEAHSFAGAMARGSNKIDVPTGKLLFREDKIKSAVEWLKERIDKQSTTRGKAYRVLMKLIDQAFPDLK